LQRVQGESLAVGGGNVVICHAGVLLAVRRSHRTLPNYRRAPDACNATAEVSHPVDLQGLFGFVRTLCRTPRPGASLKASMRETDRLPTPTTTGSHRCPTSRLTRPGARRSPSPPSAARSPAPFARSSPGPSHTDLVPRTRAVANGPGHGERPDR